MKLVILESPFAGNRARNIEYARRAIRDSLQRGEAPIASHLLYTQPGILDDDHEEERMLGIKAGLAWSRVADGVVVYADHGISLGMKISLDMHKKVRGLPVVFRFIERESDQ